MVLDQVRVVLPVESMVVGVAVSVTVGVAATGFTVTDTAVLDAVVAKPPAVA